MSEKVIELLREKGLKITPQRLSILEILKQAPEGKHLDAEEIFESLKEKGDKASLATLYRTLKLLVQEGILREMDFGEDHKHYELKTQNETEHHHMICKKCLSAFEFDEDSLEKTAKKIAKKNEFEIQDFQFKIFGTCKNCQNNKN